MTLDRRQPSAARDAHLARLETVGELSAAFVHDFNNLLTVIAGYAELLATELEPGPTRDAAREIQLAADRAAAVSTRLMDFVRPPTNDGSTGVIDAGATVASLRSLISRLAGPDHPIVMKLDRRAVTVRIESRDLELAVLNLVINARQASPDGSPIVIGIERTSGTAPGALADASADVAAANGALDGVAVSGAEAAANGAGHSEQAGAVIWVADRGPGVPVSLRERIFEPFFTSRAEHGGTGLGLAIVRRTARRWNGDARVRAHRGGGARFELRFPLAEEQP